MRPRIMTDKDWFQQSQAALKKFQEEQQWKEQKEQEALRAPIRAELKDEIEELKRASCNKEKFLDLIYSKYPPKTGERSTGPLKKQLKFALLHYHPDKQDVDAHGLKWAVLAGEITIILNDIYGCFKNVQ